MNTTGNHQADILEISCQCQICLKSTYHILIYLKIEKNTDKDEAPSSKSSQCCDKWCFCSWQTFERFELEKKKQNTSAFVEAAEIQYIVAKKRLNFQN